MVITLGAVIESKRVVFARCKKCGRIYWHFSDEEPWSVMEGRLNQHLWWHVSKGTMTPEEAREGWHRWFDLIWYRVFDPAKTRMSIKRYRALHPDFISLHDYNIWKQMAQIYPSGLINIARSAFNERLKLRNTLGG